MNERMGKYDRGTTQGMEKVRKDLKPSLEGRVFHAIYRCLLRAKGRREGEPPRHVTSKEQITVKPNRSAAHVPR